MAAHASPAAASAKRWRPLSTVSFPVFVVSDKGVACRLCDNLPIGLSTLRQHATANKDHQAALTALEQEQGADAVGFEGAVSLETAEAMLLPRITEGRKRRKKRRKSQANDEAAAVAEKAKERGAAAAESPLKGAGLVFTTACAAERADGPAL